MVGQMRARSDMREQIEINVNPGMIRTKKMRLMVGVQTSQ